MTAMNELLEKYRDSIDRTLESALKDCEPECRRLADAMRYSTFSAGKRIRPALVCAFCEACGGDWHDALDAAAAVELIHTFSLIHDDLPCMDDDDMRRGRPSCHAAFGEATALLAGDALIFKAISVVAASKRLDAAKRCKAAEVICAASGIDGMTGGQQIDMEGGSSQLSYDTVVKMYKMKTCALIALSCKLGVICAGGDERLMDLAEKYGTALGLAFQITDDLLEPEGGSDEDKSTYLSLTGRERAKADAAKFTDEACGAASALGERGDALVALCGELLGRDH